MVREASVPIGDTAADYVSFGRGTKPLVLIPGLNLRNVKGSGYALAWMYRVFARDFKVYCIDRKRQILKDYTMEAIAEDYAAAMQALGIHDSYVVGVSQGGMIAQYLAINHPELVRKLVLAVTSARSNETITSCINTWVSLVEQGDYRALGRDILEKMYSDRYVRRYGWLFPLLVAMQKPENPERFITLAKSCLTCDTYTQLHRIKCPVLVIGGNRDRLMTGEASREIAEQLGCSIYMYEGLGHAAYAEARDFNRRIYEFFTAD